MPWLLVASALQSWPVAMLITDGYQMSADRRER